MSLGMRGDNECHPVQVGIPTTSPEPEVEWLGGFNRLNKVFGGRLEQVLGDLREELWRDVR